jgi:hypothetical protein
VAKVVAEKRNSPKQSKCLPKAPSAPVVVAPVVHEQAADAVEVGNAQPCAAVTLDVEMPVAKTYAAVVQGTGNKSVASPPAVVSEPPKVLYLADSKWRKSKACSDKRVASDADVLRSIYAKNRAAPGYKLARVPMLDEPPTAPQPPQATTTPPSYGGGMFQQQESSSSSEDGDSGPPEPVAADYGDSLDTHVGMYPPRTNDSFALLSTLHVPLEPASSLPPAIAALEDDTSGLLELGGVPSFELSAQDEPMQAAPTRTLSNESTEGRLDSSDFASDERLVELGILEAPLPEEQPAVAAEDPEPVLEAVPHTQPEQHATAPLKKGGNRLKRKSFTADAAAVAAEPESPAELPDDGSFHGLGQTRKVLMKVLVEKVIECFSDEMLADLGSDGGGTTSIPLAARLKQARRTMRKDWSPSKCTDVIRSLEFLAWHCDAQGYTAYPATSDLLTDAVSEYLVLARYRAGQRDLKRVQSGEKPAATQGGKWAAKPVYGAFYSLRTLGLQYAADQAVKKASRVPVSPPTIRPMPPVEHSCHLEMVTVSETSEFSKFEKAFAGGYFLQEGSSGRTIDMQRTATIGFESTTILGVEIEVACGVPPKSKGPNQDTMAAIEWRCPLLPRYIDEPINLQPLLDSMPGTDDGCVFRGFTVEDGKKHVITNATGWANHPATHQQIIESRAAILVKCGVSEASANSCRGHDARHTMAEVGRVLVLSKQRRDLLSNHRLTPVFGEDRADKVAYRRAVREARERVQATSSRLATSSNRYSSVYAEPAVADESRLICMAAVRDAVQAWSAAGVWPKGGKRQIEDIGARARQPSDLSNVAQQFASAAATLTATLAPDPHQVLTE